MSASPTPSPHTMKPRRWSAERDRLSASPEGFFSALGSLAARPRGGVIMTSSFAVLLFHEETPQLVCGEESESRLVRDVLLSAGKPRRWTAGRSQVSASSKYLPPQGSPAAGRRGGVIMTSSFAVLLQEPRDRMPVQFRRSRMSPRAGRISSRDSSSRVSIMISMFPSSSSRRLRGRLTVTNPG